MRALDQVGQYRLQMHLQKLVNAADIFFAQRALQQEQIRFLYNMNSEAKARRSNSSLVLGKAKVISYEDIMEIRAKRSAKDQAIADKRQFDRRRRGAAPVAGVLESMGAQVAPAARMM